MEGKYAMSEAVLIAAEETVDEVGDERVSDKRNNQQISPRNIFNRYLPRQHTDLNGFLRF
jgi:hypothetical protein